MSFGSSRRVSDATDSKKSRGNKKVMEVISKVSFPIEYIKDQSEIAWRKYCNYVEKNKKGLRKMEETIRMVSFLMPGRLSNDAVSELIYGLTYVIGTINDRACDDMREATVYVGNETLFVKNLKTIIMIIQHLQVAIEIFATKKVSNEKKWKIILYIEAFKMIARLYLLFYFNGYMLIVQNQSEMDRQASLEEAENHGRFNNLQKMYVESGRNPHPLGHFTSESQSIHKNMGHSEIKRHINGNRFAKLGDFLAELLHITRPFFYVLSFIKWNKSHEWRPFMLSMLFDLYSYVFHMSNNPSVRQRQELNRRRTLWLLYLLRTPFFEKFIKNPTDYMTNNLKNNNATIRYWILSTIMALICSYQQNYFYISGSNF